MKGGIVDTEKAQRIVMTDFRGGKLGTVSLDMPPKLDAAAQADAAAHGDVPQDKGGAGGEYASESLK